MPEVVVYILEGRSLDQKRGLVKDITEAVVKNAGTTRRAGHRIAGRNGADVEGQGRRAVQRNAAAPLICGRVNPRFTHSDLWKTPVAGGLQYRRAFSGRFAPISGSA